MFASGIRRCAGDQGGGAAVEFAIVAPFLFALIAAILVLGWTMHSVSSVRYALQEAGRALQLDPEMTEADLAEIVEANLGRFAKPELTVNLTIGEPEGGFKLAQATVQYAITFPVPLLPPVEFELESSVTVPLTSS